MYKEFSTQDVPRHHEFGYWREVIGSTYFNLQLGFRDQDTFAGRLRSWDLGNVALSRLESGALSYRRLRQHCDANDQRILVTVPLKSEVEFSQLGRTLRCAPGRFLLEHSDEPYDFQHAQANDMWVLKLPESALRTRVGNTSRFCAQHFDSTQGVGRLFADYLLLMTRHCGEQRDETLHTLMGQQLIDLLAVTLNAHPDALQSTQSSVRSAHLARVEAHVRRHLADPGLDPEAIARANGISLRYLHALFKDTDRSVAQWVRDLRLQVAHERLAAGAPKASVSQVAYDVGFSDAAYFSNAFRRCYGYSPSDLLNRSV